MRRRIIVVAAVIAALGLLLAGAWGYRFATVTFPQIHAESCLQTLRHVADEAVRDLIPSGFYSKAIQRAEYMEGYYPVGAVIRSDHPFASEYTRLRNVEIRRVVRAMAEATGQNHGRDWTAWRAALKQHEPERSP